MAGGSDWQWGTRRRPLEAAANGGVVGAHEFLVAVAPRDYDRVAVIDDGRSLQKVVNAATHAGISTCWIGPGADQSSVIDALGDRFDPDHDHAICVCAIGYRSPFVPLLIRAMSAKMHRRLPLQQLFFSDDTLTRPVDVTAPPCSERVSAWFPSKQLISSGKPRRRPAARGRSGGRPGVPRSIRPAAAGLRCRPRSTTTTVALFAMGAPCVTTLLRGRIPALENCGGGRCPRDAQVDYGRVGRSRR
jgi:hypothetical protein